MSIFASHCNSIVYICLKCVVVLQCVTLVRRNSVIIKLGMKFVLCVKAVYNIVFVSPFDLKFAHAITVSGHRLLWITLLYLSILF